MSKINARQINMSKYRVENKGNVLHGATPVTSYSLYQFSESQNAFVHTYAGFAPRYDASDRMCVKHFLGRHQ